jgi:hypothetical protein
MAFHSYDQHLVVANESDMIRYASTQDVQFYFAHLSHSVWDWSTRRRINYFNNGNPKGTSITSLHIINQDVGGIIMTGSCLWQHLLVLTLFITLFQQLVVRYDCTAIMIQAWSKVQYRWSALSEA